MPENPTTPPDDPEQGIGFLRRWSERKANATPDVHADPEPTNQAIDSVVPSDPADDAGAETEVAPAVTEADLENLTYDSDYTKFMGENVPEALRRRALRQLWRSDPILANVDGLCDYDDDFTDAALAVKVLQTAHKVGQGYLTDEEVAANRARGTPPPVAEDADDVEDVINDEGEDMEDFGADKVEAEATVTAATHDDDPPAATNTDDAIAAADDDVPPDPRPA